MDNENLGARIKKQRTIKEMTQQEVADLIGVDRTTYSKYESGKASPNFNTAIRLAAIFGINVSEFSSKCDKELIEFADSTSLCNEEARLLLHFRALSERRKQEVMRVLNRLTIDQERENASKNEQ